MNRLFIDTSTKYLCIGIAKDEKVIYKFQQEAIKRQSELTIPFLQKALKENKDIKNYVPNITHPYLTDLHYIEDYFHLLKYKILTTKDLSIYQTVDEGIEKAIKKEIVKANNYQELVTALKSKR